MVYTKIFLTSLVLILFVALIPNSDATLNLENTYLQSNDGNLVIDFGKNIIQQTSSKIKTTPTLDFAIIRTIDHDFFLHFSDDVSVNVYGNSFVLKSFEKNPLLIYAQNVGGNEFVLNVYTIDNGFKKQTFTATLGLASEIEQEDSSEPSVPTVIEKLPEMNLLVKQTDRVFWQQSYYITARVFDAELNQLNEFYQNWGFIPGINILVEIFNKDNNLLTSLSGETGPAGYYEDQYYIIENLISPGEYSVNVTADNGQTELTKTLQLFILGQRSDHGTFVNATNNTGS